MSKKLVHHTKCGWKYKHSRLNNVYYVGPIYDGRKRNSLFEWSRICSKDEDEAKEIFAEIQDLPDAATVGVVDAILVGDAHDSIVSRIGEGEFGAYDKCACRGTAESPVKRLQIGSSKAGRFWMCLNCGHGYRSNPDPWLWGR